MRLLVTVLPALRLLYKVESLIQQHRKNKGHRERRDRTRRIRFRPGTVQYLLGDIGKDESATQRKPPVEIAVVVLVVEQAADEPEEDANDSGADIVRQGKILAAQQDVCKHMDVVRARIAWIS